MLPPPNMEEREVGPLIGCGLFLLALLLFVWAGRTFGWAWW
jgi:hypothetical protein